MKTITALRKDIDTIDDVLIKLLNDRFEISKEIGDLKQTDNHPIENSQREQSILSKLIAYKHAPAIRAVYDALLNESKRLQRKG